MMINNRKIYFWIDRKSSIMFGNCFRFAELYWKKRSMGNGILKDGATEHGEIVVYQPDEVTRLEVRLEYETVWLNRSQLALLFGRDVKTIGKHVNNALKEELKSFPTIAKFATVQKEGGRLVEREIEYYNLDMVISVGYRVKSDQGILFRRWATTVLKEYMIKGYTVNQRLNKIEEKLNEHDILVSTPSSTHPLDWSGRREGSARVLKQGKLRRL